VDTLPRDVWRRRAAAHQARVDGWAGPHLERRRRGERHPVEDFLFTYYRHRPAALRRWHPGYGVALADAPEYRRVKGYAEQPVTVDPAHLLRQRALLEGTRALLAATASRAAHTGCFGLHEWAMVYRLPRAEVRHATWPLRLGSDGTDAVVESHRVACSHFDAYRFFTVVARPRNALRPGPDDRPAFEQPGCLHAGMDLYRHAYRLSPLVPSELVADCFALAREIRVLDMRASPYDLSGLGYSPVRIETAAGKREYAAAQRSFAERARPLRERLLDSCERLLEAADAAGAQRSGFADSGPG
jgi:hypothetical protein